MKVKIKKLHPEAIIPTYATQGSACFDIYCLTGTVVFNRESTTIRTGLAFEVPEGYVLNIYSRSGHGFKNDVRLANCVGKIDSDYRGELMVKLTNDNDIASCMINAGDRIAQGELVPVIKVDFELTDDLSETDRGEGGFGSTGR